MNLDIRFYWGLLLKRLPVMLALFLVCAGLGVVTGYSLPPVYQTSARLLVEAPQIPDNMAASTVRTDGAEQLQIIEQQLLTRANLIDIANKHNVFENITDMTPDRVTASMLRQTRISRTSGRNQATFMTLTFEGRSGAVVANVVNEYVTLILEANNDFRISRVESTLEFFDQEVERLSNDLDAQSVKIVEFKSENSTALPDDLSYRQGRQTLLQERLGQLERQRASVERQRNDMIAIFESTGRVEDATNTPQSPEEQQLSRLRLELDQARAVFSETSPQVRLLVGQIERLETTIAGTTTEVGSETTAPASMLDITLAELDSTITELDIQIEDTQNELDRLETSIAATATNAIVLDGLEREYAAIQQRYDVAVTNLNQARMGERIEVSSQGQRISIIEAASVPQDPSGPNRRLITAAGLGAGIGLAIGFFILLELLNRKIRRPAELNMRFGLTPLAVIPYMESRRERVMRRALRAGALLAVMIGVPMALWYIDHAYMPLEILAGKIFNRLGLT